MLLESGLEVTKDVDFSDECEASGLFTDENEIDHSHVNIYFDPDGEFERNDTFGSTKEGYYQCVATDQLMTCDDNAFETNCTTYDLTISDSNLILLLTLYVLFHQDIF